MFDNIVFDLYLVCLVGKIRGFNKGVWSEIIFFRVRKVLGMSIILLVGYLVIFFSGFIRYRLV